MAIKYLGSAIYKGLSTDTKPATAANTALFIETNTRKTFVYNGTTWQPQYRFPEEYYYLIYINADNNQCEALNTVTQTVDFSNPNPNPPATSMSLETIRQAIAASTTGEITTRGRDIFILKGEYHNTGVFFGIDFPADRRLRVHLARKAKLYTPTGYNGYVFRFGKAGLGGTNNAADKVQSCELWGGEFGREGANTYTAIELYASGNQANGTYDHHIGGFYCSTAENVIKITRDENTAWINNNLFENISGDDNINHIVFNQPAGGPAPTHPYINEDLTDQDNAHINFNRFSNLRFQTNSLVQTGAKDIQGKGNMFDHCVFFDLSGNNPAATSGNITNKAFNTMVWGGTLGESISVNPGLDAGVNTMIEDNFNIVRKPDVDFHAYRRKGVTADRWYIAGMEVANTTTSTMLLVANNLRAAPFIVPTRTKFDTIACFVNTPQSASNVRMGIYKDNGNVFPGALIFDSGVQPSITGPAALQVTITPANLQWLNPGLYWLAIVENGATTATLRGIPIVACMPILGYDPALGTGAGVGWNVAHTLTTALPNPFTTSGATIWTGSGSMPALYLRAVLV